MKIGRGETNHLYVDVDGTLLVWPKPGNPGGPTDAQKANAWAYLRGEAHDAAVLPTINAQLVSRIKDWHARSGGNLMIWSMGGSYHSELARRFCGLEHERVFCLAKPDLAVDDNPLVWSKRRLDVVGPNDFTVPV